MVMCCDGYLNEPYWDDHFVTYAYIKSSHFTSCAVLCLVDQSRPALCDPMDCSLPDSSVHGDTLGKNTDVSWHVPLQGKIFPTQGSNPGLPHCSWILYHRSHQRSQVILVWVAYPFSRGSPWPIILKLHNVIDLSKSRENILKSFPIKWLRSFP